MADTGKVTYRIPLFQGYLLVGMCVLIDLLQFFLDLTGILSIISMIAGFLVEGSAMLWFMWKGVSFTSGKKALTKFLTAAGTWIVELIPIVDALPMLTIGNILIISVSRIEDKLASKTKQTNPTPHAANDNKRGERSQAA